MDRLWISFAGLTDLVLMTAGANPQALLSIDAGAHLHELVAEGGQLWGLDHEGGVVQCRRASSGALLARVGVTRSPNRMALGPQQAWVHHQLATLPATVISRSDFSIDLVEPPGVFLAVTDSALWCSSSRHYDDASLLCVDRTSGERRRLVSGQNIGPFLVREDCVWVGGYPNADRLSILTLDGIHLHEVAGRSLSHLVSDQDGVFGLRDAAQERSTVLRFAASGAVDGSFEVPGAHDLALGPQAVAVVTRQRQGGREASFLVTHDRRSLVALGRVKLRAPATSVAMVGPGSVRRGA